MRGVIEFAEYQRMSLILSECPENFKSSETVVSQVLGGVEVTIGDFYEFLRVLADLVANPQRAGAEPP
jgi:hypothetical protein